MGLLIVQNRNKRKAYSCTYFTVGYKMERVSYSLASLEGKKDFYYDMIEALGPTGTQSVINVFSTVGEKTFYLME
ncbi:MAG: hypothetical protein IPK96_19270 [Flammeovirgaceae bacterium]|nr:hypothetical protein [Flammeovirgaceae bacterium]